MEQMLLKYRACLPFDAWRQVCMHYMFLVERLLLAEEASSEKHGRSGAQSQATSLHESARESVVAEHSRVEGSTGSSSEYEYTRYQHHSWTASNAVVRAPAEGQGPEVMAWALLPAAQGPMLQLMHGVLHRLLHQVPRSV